MSDIDKNKIIPLLPEKCTLRQIDNNVEVTYLYKKTMTLTFCNTTIENVEKESIYFLGKAIEEILEMDLYSICQIVAENLVVEIVSSDSIKI